MKQEFPKVLVVSINAWRDNTGINTLINFFQKWDPEKVAQIYTRSVLPNTKVCNHFFQISENAVLKSIFKRKIQTGQEVCNECESEPQLEQSNLNAKEENKKYSFFRQHRSYFFILARDLAWKFGKWKTAELDQFIENYDADVLFLPIYAYTYMNRLQLYVIKKAKKPVVTYIADDVYSYQAEKGNLLFYINRYFLRRSIKKVMQYSEKLFVIAPKLQEEYGRIFHIDSELLTKGINFDDHPLIVHQQNHPLRMVYTGKTNIGRWQSLAMLAQEIKVQNQNGQKIFLEIYTREELTNRVSSALNIEGASKVMGGVSLEEALNLQKEADVVVFAESLSWKYKDVARLSFSTKLTDYFANAKCILAIGDSNIAPIEYLREKDAALVATNRRELHNQLEELVNNPDVIDQYSEKAYACGRENHDEVQNRERFYTGIMSVCRN